MISVRLSGQPFRHGKNFKNAVFLDILNMTDGNICMMGVITELYLSIPLLVRLTFQGYSATRLESPGWETHPHSSKYIMKKIICVWKQR